MQCFEIKQMCIWCYFMCSVIIIMYYALLLLLPLQQLITAFLWKITS